MAKLPLSFKPVFNYEILQHKSAASNAYGANFAKTLLIFGILSTTKLYFSGSIVPIDKAFVDSVSNNKT